MTNLFWIRSPNFGDALNPLLHKAIIGKDPVWADPGEQAGTVLAIGSLAHCAHPGSILWGTGAMADDMPLQCDKTTVATAVRGPLTAWLLKKQGVDISNTIFADPAILLPRYFLFPDDTPLGPPNLVIPHYADVQRAVTYKWGDDYEILSPMKDAEFLIRKISRAETVITSSLHILIVAEAYNIPVVWVEFGDSVAGKGFKFWDHFLGTVRTPPTAVQIRGDTIPWNQILDELDFWEAPKIDLQDVGDWLLQVCPFVV